MAQEPDFRRIAEWIKTEADRRKSKRSNLEKEWEEIDRQIAMLPVPRKADSGATLDWYPAIEEPLQFNALEVILADVRSSLFPPSRSSWYRVTGDMDEDMIKAAQDGLVIEGVPTRLDQEGVNAVIKAVIDYYHRLYDFRSNFMMFAAECVKYGTGSGRVREVRMDRFMNEYRGVTSGAGPAFLPLSIQSCYLDDTEALTMHEGVSIGGVMIHCETRLYEDIKAAAEAGGARRGWRGDVIDKIEPKKGEDKRGTIEILDAEGDFVIPGEKDAIFLPNSRIMVAVGAGGPEVIRFEENPMPFHSRVVGRYMRTDVKSAYGVSPLMKGRPIQESASFALNDLLACGALKAQPPVAYDRNDAMFAAKGGPEIYPRAMWGTDNPSGVIVQHQIGDPVALLQVYLAMIKKYEDLTQANDPRRGGGMKSHTTASAAQIDTIRALARTEDFVQDLIDGPLTSILYMEYEIIRKVMPKDMLIPIDSEGMNGFIRVSKEMLPEKVYFNVFGSAGVQDEAQRNQSFFTAAQFVMSLYAAAVQTGKPFDLNFRELSQEALERAGIQDTAKYIPGDENLPPTAPGLTGVPNVGEADTANTVNALQALQGLT